MDSLGLVALIPLIAGIYEGVAKVFLLTPFDAIFVQKPKLKLYSVLKLVYGSCLLVLTSVIISLYFSLGFKASSESSWILAMVSLSSTVFVASLLLLLVNSCILRFWKAPKWGWLKKSPIYIVFVHFLSLILFWGTFLSIIPSQLEANKYSVFFGLCVIAIILWIFQLNILKSILGIYKKSGEAHYRIKVSDKDLYVLGSQDPNRLILSMESKYHESDNIFIYDIDKKVITEFIPVEKKE